MKRKPVGKIIVNILVILLCCVWLVPVYMVIVNAIKKSIFFKAPWKYSSVKCFGQAKALVFFVIIALITLIQVKITGDKEVSAK